MYDEGKRGRGDDSIASEKLVSERKTFFMDLKENDRGRFLKITEDVKGRRDTIMVPVDLFDDFHDALGRILDEHDKAVDEE